ncbi:MAG: ribosomal protein S18-alanine N-acetyltransferase [Wenzhouxiangella sp.]
MVAVISEPVLSIRSMKRGDLDRVSEIETASYPYPWSRGIFADCLRVGYHCQVLLADDQICGYGIVSMALDEAHLLNLCIAPEYRRQGLAALLLDHLLREVTLKAMDRLFLEVRPSNKGALALYRQSGFRVIGRRPGYYPAPDGREDAIIMVLHLDAASA